MPSGFFLEIYFKIKVLVGFLKNEAVATVLCFCRAFNKNEEKGRFCRWGGEEDGHGLQPCMENWMRSGWPCRTEGAVRLVLWLEGLRPF